MSRAYRPIDPDLLPGLLGDAVAERDGVVRVAVDGPECTHPRDLAHALAERLRVRGRSTVTIDSRTFWRDASLRLEHGREDPDSLPGWLDAEALRREVLDPVRSAGRYLPSLRDPETNRTTRAGYRTATPDTVVVVAGSLLLGHHLPFDVTIHLAVSPATLARRTARRDAWTLPAFDAYARGHEPERTADIAVRLDHPRRPAISMCTGS